jgi:replicative superfamily II helicase
VYDREDGDASQRVTDGTQEDLGCVVVDESHMLDDSECVVILENMLV